MHTGLKEIPSCPLAVREDVNDGLLDWALGIAWWPSKAVEGKLGVLV